MTLQLLAPSHGTCKWPGSFDVHASIPRDCTPRFKSRPRLSRQAQSYPMHMTASSTITPTDLTPQPPPKLERRRGSLLSLVPNVLDELQAPGEVSTRLSILRAVSSPPSAHSAVLPQQELASPEHTRRPSPLPSVANEHYSTARVFQELENISQSAGILDDRDGGGPSPEPFVALDDDMIVPFIDRPKEVDELLQSSINQDFFRLLWDTIGGDRTLEPPSESRSPSTWSAGQLHHFMGVPRSEVSDSEWIRLIRDCVVGHSEMMWEKLAACLGLQGLVFPELDVSHPPAAAEAAEDVDMAAADLEVTEILVGEPVVRSSRAQEELEKVHSPASQPSQGSKVHFAEDPASPQSITDSSSSLSPPSPSKGNGGLRLMHRSRSAGGNSPRTRWHHRTGSASSLGSQTSFMMETIEENENRALPDLASLASGAGADAPTAPNDPTVSPPSRTPPTSPRSVLGLCFSTSSSAPADLSRLVASPSSTSPGKSPWRSTFDGQAPRIAGVTPNFEPDKPHVQASFSELVRRASYEADIEQYSDSSESGEDRQSTKHGQATEDIAGLGKGPGRVYTFGKKGPAAVQNESDDVTDQA